MGFFDRAKTEETSRAYLRVAPRLQRKDLLAAAAINAIAALPASRQGCGRPVATGYGLDEATAVVRSVMHQDHALYAWVARSALVSLDALLDAMEGSWDVNLDAAMRVVGLDPGPTIRPEERRGLSGEVQENAVGLASYALSIFWVIAQPAAESSQPRDRTIYDHLFSSTAPATRETAYDAVAWTAIVIGRLRNSGRLPEVAWFGAEFQRVPAMDRPGWYPNPYNRGDIVDGDATFQRIWDGNDWTDLIRNRDGSRWQEQDHSMHTPPNN